MDLHLGVSMLRPKQESKKRKAQVTKDQDFVENCPRIKAKEIISFTIIDYHFEGCTWDSYLREHLRMND